MTCQIAQRFMKNKFQRKTPLFSGPQQQLIYNIKMGSNSSWIHNLTSTLHGLRMHKEETPFNALPKINSQIFRCGRSIFCLPHLLIFDPKFAHTIYCKLKRKAGIQGLKPVQNSKLPFSSRRFEFEFHTAV